MSIEKMFDEREERARVRGIYWAAVLIWAGLVFGAGVMDFLPEVGNADAWTYAILGAGLIGTVMNVSYASSSDTLTPTSWDWIWSGFWLLVGLGGFFDIAIFWPLTLVLVGLIALVSAIRRS